jgi:hypothetical protein
MDARHFDTLTRVLSAGGSRRRVLARMATLPVLGGVFSLLGPGEADAGSRRKRRKKRRKRKKPCTPETYAVTCAGACGSVTNNCKKPVDCGSCDCNPACTECFTCQGAAGAPGTCVPRAAGTPCGDATTCVSGTLHPQGSCDGSGTCQPGTSSPCVAGSHCNDSGECVDDLPNGATCTNGGQCISGFCVNAVCCDTACDGACDTCNAGGSAGTCTPTPGCS